ncbi:MAG: AI-2E family transporter [Ignavibacteriaceae bacterium]|nr:AI-2E family transporter [Ignavibacteriaceae bacterium]
MTDFTYKKFIKPILWLVGIVIFFYLLYLLSDIIIIISIAILLSFIFAPIVAVFEGKGFSRLTATLFSFGIIGLLVYLVLSVIIPKFILQMNHLIVALQKFDFAQELKSIETAIISSLPFLEPGDISSRLQDFFSLQIVNSFQNLTSLLSGIVSVVAILVIVPFITFFFLKDSKRILQGMLNLMPNKYFEMSYWILKKVSLQLGLFVRAWIFDATFVGVMIGFGFYFIGLENALPLGVIAGLGHLIRYFGPIIGGIPAIIISIVQFGDFSQVPIITFIVLLTYALDNGFVQPYVFGKSVDMHPIMIILLIIAGGTLFGLIGMLLAVPVATVIKTFAKEIYFATKNYKIARV